MAYSIMAFLGCPICNVDGLLTRNFIGVVFGAVTLGYVFFLLWSIGRGQFKDVEKPKFRMLELEKKTGVKK